MARTSIATVCLSGTLDDRLDAAAEAGFDAVEIFENDLIASARSPAEIRRRVAGRGLTVDLYQPFRDAEGAPPDRFAAVVRRLSAKLDLMRELGADTILICSSVAPDTIDDDALAASQLRTLAGMAEARGMRIAYEALAWGRHVSTWRHSWDIVRAAGHPALGLCLDSFHVLSRTDDYAAIADLPGDRVFFLQLADAPRLSMDVLQWSRHHRLFPLQGSLDLAGFTRAVLDTGYSGPLSLEVFNDVFRQADPRRTAIDARRSLIALMEDVGSPLTPAPELSGIAFAELGVDGRSGPEVRRLLRALGFTRTGQHRSKPVQLWEQGRARILLNSGGVTEAHGGLTTAEGGIATAEGGVIAAGGGATAAEAGIFAAENGAGTAGGGATAGEAGILAAENGAGTAGGGSNAAGSGAGAVAAEGYPGAAAIRAFALESTDPRRSARRAAELLARPLPRRRGRREADLTAVAAPDGTEVFFCRTDGVEGGWLDDFLPTGEAGAPGAGITAFDHLSLAQPFDRFDEASLFYRGVLGLTGDEAGEVAAPFGLIRTLAVRDRHRRVRLALSVPVLRRGDWAPAVGHPQHLTLASDDLARTAAAMTAAGVPPLPIPANYYDDLEARVELPPGTAGTLRGIGAMYDEDAYGHYLQLFTPMAGTRVFIEVVQRVSGYRGYGFANEPVRMAAHRHQRLAHQSPR